MIRTKFIDFDARRDPKTNRYCVCCQKDLKEGQPHRVVFVGEAMHAIHPDDIEQYLALPIGQRSSIQIGAELMGMACAKKLGIEFTSPEGTETPADPVREAWKERPK